MNRPPGKKEALLIERREEGDTQSSVGHSIKDTMRNCNNKEKTRERQWPAKHVAEGCGEANRKNGSKNNRVHHAAVAPQIAIWNPHIKTNGI